ncbi:MAG TPA: hypothetical protein VHZ95_04045 [Polyangiales bacterium]|nr:hypothetical protein [Polyangiales bacterium]
MTSALAASLHEHGFVRRVRAQREWLHVHVCGDDLDLIVNASILGADRTRVLVLVRDGGGWSGDVEDIASSRTDVRGGQLFLRAGATTIALVGDILEVRGALSDGSIAFDLRLRPETFASIARDVALAQGSLSWVVTPRLAATGTCVVGDRAHRLVAAPAYHDHNWGVFDHDDFTWRWGHAHAGSSTVVVSSLLDRNGSTSFLQTLMLWSGPRLTRMFRGDELSLRPIGCLRPPRSLVVPRFASLLTDGATEVPKEIVIEARADGDHLCGRFVARDLARVVVPDDRLRTTVIHEVVGTLQLCGEVNRCPVAFDTRAAFEFLRGVR